MSSPGSQNVSPARTVGSNRGGGGGGSSGNDNLDLDTNIRNMGKLGLDDGQDLSLFVQDMLDQMQNRFSKTGDNIRARMDEMGKRMDDLEASISDLMDQADLESPDGASLSASPSKSTGGSNGSRATSRGDEVL